MKRYFLALLWVPFSWGCDQRPDDGRIRQNPRKSIEENLRGAELSCASADACPANVGYLLANFGEDQIGQCTGWLIAPDVVATNSHCIPDDVKADPARCAGNVGVKLPRTEGRAEEVLLCAELLQASAITAEGDADFLRKPDYALFRVSHASARAPLAFARGGIAEGQPLTLLSVDPQSRTRPEGLLVQRVCRASKNSINIPDDTHELSDVAVAFGDACVARHGNSGSPVLDEAGRAIGWLHGGIPAEEDPVQNLRDKSVVESTLRRPVILTNGACVPALATVPTLGAPGPGCAGPARAQLEARRAGERNERLRASFAEKMRAPYDRWAVQASNIFKFSAQVAPPDLSARDRRIEIPVELQVLCLQPREQWSTPSLVSSYALSTPPGADGKPGTDKLLNVRMLAPTLVVEKKIDPYWRITFTVELRYDRAITIALNPEHLERPGTLLRPGAEERAFRTRSCLPTEFGRNSTLELRP